MKILVYNVVSEYNREIILVIILSLYKGEIIDEKEIISFNYEYVICYINYEFKLC